MNKGVFNPIKNFLYKNFKILHFLILPFCYIGIIKLFILNYITPLEPNMYEYHYLTDTVIQLNLLIYLFSAALIFLYFLFFIFFIKKEVIWEFKLEDITLLILTDLLCIVAVFINCGVIYPAIAFLLVVFTTILPNLILKEKFNMAILKNRLIKYMNCFKSYDFTKAYKILFALVAIQFICIFFPLIFGKLTVGNEFINIPSITIINKVQYDDDNFIADNNLFSAAKERKYERGQEDIKYLKSEFFKYNTKQITDQIIDRNWFSHQSYFILPLNELSLGKPLDKIYMQYGYGGTVIVNKILSHFNGITYQDTYKILQLIQYFYYFSLILILFAIFKEIEYVLPIWVISVFGLNKLGFFPIYIGPGVTPLRHFLDIFVLFFLYLYLKSDKKVFGLILPMLLFSAIFIHKSYGMFIALSMIGCFFIKLISDCVENKKIKVFDIVILILSIISSFYANFKYNIGFDPLSKFYILGAVGFEHFHTSSLLIFFGLTIAYYFIFLKYKTTSISLAYCGLFLSLYAQIYFIYYIMAPESSHFYNMYVMLVLPFAFWSIILFENINILKAYKQKIILSFLTIFVFLYYIPSIFYFYETKSYCTRPLRHHVLYDWTFKRAKIKSVINPIYIADSVNLINKYSSSDKGIYIISVYDKLLPFLSGKYSQMPYFDVEWFIFNEEMLNTCINTIEMAKPQYLYVDKTFKTPIIEKESQKIGGLHKESLYKYERNERMKEIYEAVKDDYKAVDGSFLLTVYKRVK